MAKIKRELENNMITTVFTHPAFKRPERKQENTSFARCDCGKPAVYELYEHHEPHCRKHMLEAIESKDFVLVRSLEGGYDDAS